MKKINIKLLILGAVIVASLLVYQWDAVMSFINSDSHNNESAMQHAQKHIDPTYVCPMHSQITDNKASACPICGMDLELREVENRSNESSGIYVSAAMVNNLGVHVKHVEKGVVSEEIYASGYVEVVSVAEERDITSQVSGTVQKRVVNIGQWVEAGDVLVTINVAGYEKIQTDYIQALEDSKMTVALKLRKKLVEMGVGDYVLAGYDEERPFSKYLEIVAPFSGEVTWILGDASVAVEVGSRLVHITAPSLAEVDLRSYSRLARGVKVGHQGILSVAHLPGRSWPGRIVEVVHNRGGFFTSLRFHVKVPSGVLEAGAFAGAYVDGGTVKEVIRVPASALIYDESSARVIRLRDDDLFEVVEVQLGYVGHEWIEVLSGLQEGDHVVTRGQFLIDSEATLQAGFKRFTNQETHSD